MFLPAKLAVSRRQAVVHSMFHRRQSSQISEDCLQIVVVEVGELSERHDRRQLSRLHISGAHDLDERRFVVVADTGSVGSDVGARDVSPRSLQVFAASRTPARESGPSGRSRCDSRSQRSTRYFPRSAGLACGPGPLTGLVRRLRHSANQIVDRKIHLGRRQRISHRRDRPHVDHDGRQIFVRNRAVGFVGHHGKDRAPVVAMPSRMARAIWSSVQRPAPVSGSGVRFEATIVPGKPGTGITWPASSMPGRLGAP